MTRLHARRVEALAVKLQVEGGWRIASPQPGAFHPAILKGPVSARDVIGTLAVLGTMIEVAVPAGVSGWIDGEIAPRVVDHGDLLATLIPMKTAVDAPDAPDAAEQLSASGPVFRAPTSGRYYGRSAPDKPPFLTVGAELHTGATVCLLEVMKTFNRITYDGQRARVRELLVAEGADVNAGDPLVSLEPI
jgi:biotin carboxyl carrier protein